MKQFVIRSSVSQVQLSLKQLVVAISKVSAGTKIIFSALGITFSSPRSTYEANHIAKIIGKTDDW